MNVPKPDFSRLRTPPHSGDVLVEPSPPEMRAALEGNMNLVARWDLRLADLDLRTARREVRRRDGAPDAPTVVIGHQPEFIHPGVWAKHVVAARLARAVGGTAVNLVVDTDRPRQTHLSVPTFRHGSLIADTLPFAFLPSYPTYESIPRLDGPAVRRFERTLGEFMGPRFGHSMMPAYCRALASAPKAADFVDQTVFASRSVEGSLGVDLLDRRVSRCSFQPLLVEMLANGERFHACYNAALGEYRRRQGISGTQRPIPDLVRAGRRFELPVWVTHAARPRGRLMVETRSDRLLLSADQQPLGNLHLAALKRWDTADEALTSLDDVLFRPRALTLTLWARMLLADLFVHGIGGAKYDRITDLLIRHYFGVTPPAIACVSATLRLDLPHDQASPARRRRLHQQLRDLRYNPQRHLQPGPDLAELIEARAQAVRRSDQLRQARLPNRAQRRAIFNEIRSVNSRLLQARPEALRRIKAELQQARDQVRENEVARRRDYFFALFSREALEGLCRALPGVEDFRV